MPVPLHVLSAAGVEPWTALPFWTPPEDDAIVNVSGARALAAGLTLRPLADTAAATAAWLRSPERGELPRFLNRERELGIIASLADESAGGSGPA